ncbi:MAG: FAD:protein FMN transferase [Deltaproteobacteria bacterium]|nr:FAD:protein FMN transferase [Deltaproteobacteria bacterium]
MFISACIFAIPTLALSENPPYAPKTLERGFTVMGTELKVKIYSSTAAEEAAALNGFDAVLKEFQRIEDMMSEWKEGSAISEINRNAGIQPVRTPPELFTVIRASIEVSKITGGAFDVSWAAMRGLWNFTPGSEKVPDKKGIEKRLPLVNYKNIIIDEKNMTVFLKKKGMAIGLGAIAKGYAVDMAMMELKKLGMNNALITAGGDMRVQGKEGSEKWRIAVKHPRDKTKLLLSLPLENISISTSGDYERYFIKDNVLYHHIMSPKTGYPARGARSVTIIGPDTMTTDALATAVFVMGAKEGMALVEKLPGIEAIIIDTEGSMTKSSGIN